MSRKLNIMPLPLIFVTLLIHIVVTNDGWSVYFFDVFLCILRVRGSFRNFVIIRPPDRFIFFSALNVMGGEGSGEGSENVASRPLNDLV